MADDTSQMGSVEDLESLWESNIGLNIKEVIDKCLDLLNKAKLDNEVVPIKLENDIVLLANNALGYGTKEIEAEHIMNLLSRNLSSEKDDLTKIHRLISIAISSLIATLSSDEQNNEKTVVNVMKDYGIDISTTRVKIIQVMLENIMTIINKSRPDYWYMETISFALILIGMLQEMDKWEGGITKSLESIKITFEEPLLDIEQQNIDRWKESWSEKSDYFRFVVLMIFNKHSQEDRWKNLAKYLVS